MLSLTAWMYTLPLCMYTCIRSEDETYAEEDKHYPRLPSCVTEELRSAICVACVWHNYNTHTPSHPSAADEAWLWPKCFCVLGDCLNI